MKTLILTSEEVLALRKRQLRLNQVEFWKPLGVTQSGGSRYESGRNIPKPVQMLIRLAYGTKTEAQKVLDELRKHTGDK